MNASRPTKSGIDLPRWEKRGTILSTGTNCRRIELVFSLLKEQLGLHIFWSAKEELVLIQLWAAIILAQVLISLRFQIAEEALVDFFDVSIEILIDLLKHLTHSRGFAVWWSRVDFGN
jgi:hypothetical protein